MNAAKTEKGMTVISERNTVESRSGNSNGIGGKLSFQ